MLGSLNPLPFRVGGGATPSSRAYSLLRGAVGEGGSARNDAGLEGLWRRSRAKGLAASGSATRRALLQAWAHLATDFIPSWERLLGLVPEIGATETERRDRIVATLTARLSVAWESLEAELQKIDPRLSLIVQDPDLAITTIPGRAFEAHDSGAEGPAFGGLGYSLLPAYSSHDDLRVLFSVGYSTALIPADERIVETAKRTLRALLPSWKSFSFVTSSGFLLGTSPLGLTALEET